MPGGPLRALPSVDELAAVFYLCMVRFRHFLLNGGKLCVKCLQLMFTHGHRPLFSGLDMTWAVNVGTGVHKCYFFFLLACCLALEPCSLDIYI